VKTRFFYHKMRSFRIFRCKRKACFFVWQ